MPKATHHSAKRANALPSDEGLNFTYPSPVDTRIKSAADPLERRELFAASARSSKRRAILMQRRQSNQIFVIKPELLLPRTDTLGTQYANQSEPSYNDESYASSHYTPNQSEPMPKPKDKQQDQKDMGENI